ncbi:formylglycine-generating enzyme family protein [Limnoglobus roseus]|nr:formylglycine-generating enzyme family protein [Limnoglobus roseus]
MRLALVPAGKFIMGSPKQEAGRADDEDQHAVEITKPFYMGVYHVTQDQYAKVVGKNPSWFSPRGSARGKLTDRDTGSYPVDNVSWKDAQQFCEKLTDLDKKDGKHRTYRLPTEAEWEYACREAGASKTAFSFGDMLGSDAANFDGNFPLGTKKGPYLARSCKAGSYPANKLGLYDMHGNIWQWCSDWYQAGYYRSGPEKDPPGPQRGSSRVMRGGAWCVTAKECRSAYRGNESPTFSDGTVGFRVLCHASE